MAAMFFDEAFSQLGRKSEQNLQGLRKQLGVGVDPAFDYTQMTELAKKVSKKTEKKPDTLRDSSKDDKASLSGLEQLRRALKEVVGVSASAEDGADREEEGHGSATKASLEDKISPAQIRAQREAGRNTSSFVATTRDERERAKSTTQRFRAPPLGSYRAKDDVIRLPITRNVEFGLRTPTKSLRVKELEKQIAQLKDDNKPYDHLVKHSVSVELSEETPSRMSSHVGFYDLSKSLPHLDPVKNMVPRGAMTYNVNSFTAGVLHGDLSCSHTSRPPIWDFEKNLKDDPSVRDTHFQPGQYKLNMEAVRPKLVYKTVPFGEQRERQRMKEAVGLFEIEDRPGAHLPDRSLSRSCTLLTHRERVRGVDIAKGMARPNHWKAGDGYHDATDPEIHERVFQHDLNYDAVEASKVVARRSRTADSFDRSLTREDELRRTKTYSNDVALRMADRNIKRGAPLSTELLSEVDSSKLKKRLYNVDLHQMVGREPEKRHVESPSRHRDQGKATKFERDVRTGDTLVDCGSLSPTSKGIMSLRATRTWEDLAAADHPDD